MPELPEVETVRRNLQGLVAGRRILRVRVTLPRIVRSPDVAEFAARVSQCTIRDVLRRGKYLLFDLGRDTLVSHLRMEGRYSVKRADDAEELHTHVVFDLDGDWQLRYQDVRQFGTMDLVPSDDLTRLAGLRDLGREPLDPSFTGAYLRAAAARRRTPVKALLLNQTVVAGLGNIYVDEVLFRARVHPERQSSELTKGQCDAIAENARRTISLAVEAGGSSVRSYVNGLGAQGTFQSLLQVYGRAGQPCAACGGAIEKIRVAGRGTHICPRCQRMPGRRQTKGVRKE